MYSKDLLSSSKLTYLVTFNVSTFSDAIVRYDGKEFKVHDLVLFGQSKYFSKAFAGDWKVCQP
jgi:hypothetical protein